MPISIQNNRFFFENFSPESDKGIVCYDSGFKKMTLLALKTLNFIHILDINDYIINQTLSDGSVIHLSKESLENWQQKKSELLGENGTLVPIETISKCFANVYHPQSVDFDFPIFPTLQKLHQKRKAVVEILEDLNTKDNQYINQIAQVRYACMQKLENLDTQIQERESQIHNIPDTDFEAQEEEVRQQINILKETYDTMLEDLNFSLPDLEAILEKINVLETRLSEGVESSIEIEEEPVMDLTSFFNTIYNDPEKSWAVSCLNPILTPFEEKISAIEINYAEDGESFSFAVHFEEENRFRIPIPFEGKIKKLMPEGIHAHLAKTFSGTVSATTLSFDDHVFNADIFIKASWPLGGNYQTSMAAIENHGEAFKTTLTGGSLVTILKPFMAPVPGWQLFYILSVIEAEE